jgi:hypothetical protein
MSLYAVCVMVPICWRVALVAVFTTDEKAQEFAAIFEAALKEKKRAGGVFAGLMHVDHPPVLPANIDTASVEDALAQYESSLKTIWASGWVDYVFPDSPDAEHYKKATK